MSGKSENVTYPLQEKELKPTASKAPGKILNSIDNTKLVACLNEGLLEMYKNELKAK